MYGTVARLHVGEGKEAALLALMERVGNPARTEAPAGQVFDIVLRSDSDSREFFLAAGFASREAYRANAESPEQHRIYEELRPLLDSDPEWHDGEIILDRRD